MIFCNGSNYDYHFNMEELVKKIEEEFHCLAENTEKYKTVSVPVTNEDNRADKNGKETAKTIFYKWQFIGTAKFMASSLSNRFVKLAVGTQKIKRKHENDNNKNWNSVELNAKIVSVVSNIQTLKMI